MHYVYIVVCSDNSLYTGVAKDLEKRIDAHNGKIKGGAVYTLSRRPVKLVYAETFNNFGDALRREAEIKRLTRRKKLQLIKQEESQ